MSEGGYPDTTHWTFQSLGYHGDNRDKLWGFLPDQYRISETVDQDGNDAIDRERMPENFGIPMPLFIFPLLCNGEERVDGESGWHYTLPTRTDADMVNFRSTDKGIYPDENGIYHIQFVSMFKPQVELLPNMQVVTNKTTLCQMEDARNDATHAYYTNLEFKIDDSWTASYYSPDSEITAEDKHAHATILVKVFGDRFDFSQSQFHLKNPKINLEPAQPDLIHRNSDDATLGFFFETFGMQLTQDCFVFPDGRDFCSNDDYALKFYVNDKKIDDLSKYLISEDDRILISYGPESEQEIEEQITDLESMAKYNYLSLEKLMMVDVGTVKDGTYNGDLGFRIVEKMMMIEMERHNEKSMLENTLNQKQHQYDIRVEQGEDPVTLELLLNEIRQLETKLKEMPEDGGMQHTSEDIFQRTSEIEAENIKMYKFGPEEYERHVTAKKALEDDLKERIGSDLLFLVQINPETKSLEVVLSKDMRGDSATIDQINSVIEEAVQDNISWNITFSEQ